MDLSLYKDESQLDKISSNKRKSSKKSSEEDNEDSDEPLKKKPATKLVTTPKKINTPRSTARKPAIVEPESSESDEENLMEIKKKAKNQVGILKFLHFNKKIKKITHNCRHQQSRKSHQKIN